MNQFVRRDGDDPFVSNNAEAAPAMYGHLNAIVDVVNTKSTVSTGVVAPTSTPSTVGDLFIDTDASAIYIAVGTSSSADWIELAQV
jgi:hypothetical protein